MSVERNPGEAYPSPDFEISDGEVRVRLNEGDVTIQGADPAGPVLWRVGQFWALGQPQAEAHQAIGEMTMVNRDGSPWSAPTTTENTSARRSGGSKAPSEPPAEAEPPIQE